MFEVYQQTDINSHDVWPSLDASGCTIRLAPTGCPSKDTSGKHDSIMFDPGEPMIVGTTQMIDVYASGSLEAGSPNGSYFGFWHYSLQVSLDMDRSTHTKGLVVSDD
jgi:hypothetical protein